MQGSFLVRKKSQLFLQVELIVVEGGQGTFQQLPGIRQKNTFPNKTKKFHTVILFKILHMLRDGGL